ncbi:MAG: DNA polymerase III subunit epsilon [Acetobacteraceae bacterium]|nr:DNA polymerase III subunit epsilon [Acetobacteraceae bacterium]MBV8525758.1 DNA polymerase III subunit epsilon [Acetobacteraceae bacterium]MBV8591743.1 DNA polymerase III subunit epsilon [Acetobacteraceae bacterium]
MNRSVIFDTETTGLEPGQGHRVLEVAAMELINDIPTGRHYHTLIDPCRDVPEDATQIHGFTSAHLAGKPRFEVIVDDLLAFLGDGKLIAHNAAFDFAFLDAELALLGLSALDPGRMVCTLELARSRFPGLPNSLDALCRRYGIDLSARNSHNALLDCRLLAQVYIELTGGRQRGLSLILDRVDRPMHAYAVSGSRTPRLIRPSEAERAAHAAFVARLKDAVWDLAGTALSA